MRKIKTIAHRELVNGMLNWRVGILMRVVNYRHFESMDPEDKGRKLVRFNGEILNDDKLKGTAFDMGTYGGWDDVPTAIQMCEWFAGCDNHATTLQDHPVLGPVPICQRCLDKYNRLNG